MNKKRLSKELLAIAKPVFEKWHIFLAKPLWNDKQLPHEFGKKMDTLLLAADIDTRVKNEIKSSLAGKLFWDGVTFVNIPKDMLRVSDELGIAVQRTPYFCYIRDYFFRLSDGKVVRAYLSPYLAEATFRTHSSNIYLSRVAATHTANQFFNVWSGHTNSYHARIYKEQEKLLKNTAKILTYTYLEGGNAFILKNEKKQLKALVGNDHLIQTFHTLELEKRCWKSLARGLGLDYTALYTQISLSLVPEKTAKVAEEMFAQGLIIQNNILGLITRQHQLDIMLLKFFSQSKMQGNANVKELLHKVTTEKGFIHPFIFEENTHLTYRSFVVDYLVKLEITRNLMAQDLQVKAADLHFITQFHYHLDLFLTPGPCGSVFLTNYAICIDFLKALKEQAVSLNLTEKDLEYIERYSASAIKMNKELGSLLKEAEEQLKLAGFKVLPTPGHWVYEHEAMYSEFPMPSGGFNINFMNAVTGFSPKIRRHYYITYGTSVGDRLGDIVMEAFCAFLAQYVPEIEVYFIGANSENPKCFDEAMDWWNRLETQSGLHCTSFEL